MAANDVFLELKGIDGESKSKPKAIDIEKLSFGVRAPHDAFTGQPVGKREHSGLTCVKHTDKSSPLLMKALFTNQNIDSGKITVRKAGLSQQEYLTIELEDIYVTSFTLNGSSGAESEIPTETVQLGYRKITVTYKEQTSLGTLGGQTVATDDLGIPGE